MNSNGMQCYMVACDSSNRLGRIPTASFIAIAHCPRPRLHRRQAAGRCFSRWWLWVKFRIAFHSKLWSGGVKKVEEGNSDFFLLLYTSQPHSTVALEAPRRGHNFLLTGKARAVCRWALWEASQYSPVVSGKCLVLHKFCSSNNPLEFHSPDKWTLQKVFLRIESLKSTCQINIRVALLER